MAAREPVVVVRERAIVAPVAAVWSVIADPAVLARLDPRLCLVSAEGEPGAVGSTYALAMRAGAWTRVTTTTLVTDAEPAVRIVSESSFRGRVLGEQRGDLRTQGDAVVLRWTVTQWPNRLLRSAAVRTAERELPLWLEAVERAAVAVA